MWAKEIIKSNNEIKNGINVGRGYCPACCIVEWRTKKVLKPMLFGLFTKKVDEKYIYSTPENEYPEQYEVGHETFCSSCNHAVSFKIDLGG